MQMHCLMCNTYLWKEMLAGSCPSVFAGCTVAAAAAAVAVGLSSSAARDSVRGAASGVLLRAAWKNWSPMT